MVYTANWGIICHLPPFTGTKNNHWFGQGLKGIVVYTQWSPIYHTTDCHRTAIMKSRHESWRKHITKTSNDIDHHHLSFLGGQCNSLLDTCNIDECFYPQVLGWTIRHDVWVHHHLDLFDEWTTYIIPSFTCYLLVSHNMTDSFRGEPETCLVNIGTLVCVP